MSRDPLDLPPAAKRLKLALQRKGCRQSDLAEKLGETPATISRWLNGKYEPPFAQLAELCRLLGISADEVLGLPTRVNEAPRRDGDSIGLSEVVASVASGAPRFDLYDKGGKQRTYHFREEFLKYLGYDERDPERFIPVRLADSLHADSMSPTIQPKALLLVDRGPKPEPRGVRLLRDVRDGGIYLVVHEGGLTVKRVFKGDKVIMLWSDNPLQPRTPLRLEEVEDLSRLLVARALGGADARRRSEGVEGALVDS